MTDTGFEGVFNLCVGAGDDAGEWMAARPSAAADLGHRQLRMGRSVGNVVAQRLGRCLLELGGNNGVIVTRDRRPRTGAAGGACSPRSARPASDARRCGG